MDKTNLHLQTEMETIMASTPSPGENKSNVTILLDLEAFQNYISVLVTYRISRTSYDLVPFEERPDVIMDVTQNAWVKLLLSTNSLKVEINSPRGYLGSIANSEFIDEIRRRKRKFSTPLPLDFDGEVSQGKILLSVHPGMRDPAIEYEEKEFIAEIIDAVLQLPPKQMYVMICILKGEIGQTSPLAEIFLAHGINIEAINWPEEPKELQRLRSLSSVARKTLRKKFNRSPGHTCP